MKNQWLIKSILHSYSTLFYAEKSWLGILLLVASALQPQAGVCGLLAVIFANIFAWLHNYPLATIRTGWYGYNAMLLGVGVGAMYEPSGVLFVMLVVGSWLAFALTVFFSTILAKYGLTPLNLPFLMAIWSVQLAGGRLGSIQYNEKIVYFLNFLYKIGGTTAIEWYNWLQEQPLPFMVSTYLRTLSALFFQDNIIAGGLIAISIFLYSRIAFSLTGLGFAVAFLTHILMGADIKLLLEFDAAFNLMILSMALGAFYTIPSIWSYSLAAFGVLVATFLGFALQKPFALLGLHPFSLAFSLTTWLFIYVLKHRLTNQKPQLSWQMGITPEMAIYKQNIFKERYKKIFPIRLQLPFWGQWMVSQGHDGHTTHLGAWAKAWDFVILDNEMKTFNIVNNSTTLQNSDFHCYNKPITAPADGFVIDVLDFVEENLVGDVNTLQNWGNTVVLQHKPIFSVGTEGVIFSQLSHLKPNSVKVKKGDFVRQGDIIGTCGSSGRSPEPHLHFQLQLLPNIGAPTLDYPIAYFLEKKNNETIFRQFERPTEGSFVSNIEVNSLISNAFYFIPKKILAFDFTDEKGQTHHEKWEVFTDAYNYTYFYCHRTKAVAYFVNDGTLFYTTEYYGEKDCLLFYFYLANYKILLGYYQNLPVVDHIPLHLFRRKWLGWIADFFAPFHAISEATYRSEAVETDNFYHPNRIVLKSSITVTVFKRKVQSIDFQIVLKENQISEITIYKKEKISVATQSLLSISSTEGNS